MLLRNGPAAVIRFNMTRALEVDALRSFNECETVTVDGSHIGMRGVQDCAQHTAVYRDVIAAWTVLRGIAGSRSRKSTAALEGSA